MSRSTQGSHLNPSGAGRFGASLGASSGIHGGLFAALALAGTWWSLDRSLEPAPAHQVRSIVLAAPPTFAEELPETLVVAEPVAVEEEPELVEDDALPQPAADSFAPADRSEVALLPPPTWDDMDWAVEALEGEKVADPEGDEVIALATPESRVVDAVLLDAPSPRYPRLSIRSGEEGTVRCRIFVAPDGSVAAVTVETSSGRPRLDAAALEALRAWRFLPRTEDGVAVASELSHPVTFVLTPR